MRTILLSVATAVALSAGVLLLLKLGRRVSTERVKVLLLSDPSAFSFPAESENFDEATLISPLVVLSAVGVNVAV